MNDENLKKGKKTQFKSGEQAAKSGKKGGLASGKAKREKKALKEIAQQLLKSTPISDKSSAKLAAMGIDPQDLTVQAEWLLSVIAHGIKNGDVKALQEFMKIAGEVEEETTDNSLTITVTNAAKPKRGGR